MKACLIGILSLCLTFFPLYVHAESNTSPTQKITKLANQIYESISEQHLEIAMSELDDFRTAWEEMSIKDKNISPVAMRSIQVSEEKLTNQLENNASEKIINETSVEFRLAVDALVNSQHPLWLGMKDKALGAFNKVEQDVTTGKARAFQIDLNHFIDVYQMIYPSMTIDIKPDVLKNLDFKINHLINNRATIIQDQSTHVPHLKEIHDELSQVFGVAEETGGVIHAPKILTPSLFIGGLVAFTLLYVVWKKYRGESKATTHVTGIK